MDLNTIEQLLNILGQNGKGIIVGVGTIGVLFVFVAIVIKILISKNIPININITINSAGINTFQQH